MSSVLKNETLIETPRDVDGVLDLCHVLIKDQGDATPAPGVNTAKEVRRQGPHFSERDDVVEEQGWLARMVHLFRAESLGVQFEVSGRNDGDRFLTERRHYTAVADGTKAL